MSKGGGRVGGGEGLPGVEDAGAPSSRHPFHTSHPSTPRPPGPLRVVISGPERAFTCQHTPRSFTTLLPPPVSPAHPPYLPLPPDFLALRTPFPLPPLCLTLPPPRTPPPPPYPSPQIVAPGLEHAVAGTSLFVVGPDDDMEELKDAVMEDMAVRIILYTSCTYNTYNTYNLYI